MKTDTSNGADAATLSTLAPLITALGTAIAAWKLFEPKFARIRAMRTEMGSLEQAFWWFYVVPQRVLSALLWLVAGYLFLSFLIPVQPNWFAGHTLVLSLVRPENTLWVIFASGVIAATIYWNLATYALLKLAALVSWIPIPGLWRHFGARGRSAGWHQAKAVNEGPDKGFPLMVSQEELDRVAGMLLARLSGAAPSPDRAAEPTGLSASEKANLAFFGCILEAEYGANRWPRPDWARFYAALEDVQNANGLFTPSSVVACQTGAEYFDQLRRALAKALVERGQKEPPDRALAAEMSISTAWTRLKEKADGDLLRLSHPVPARASGMRIRWLNWRLQGFPRLSGDSMRPQLLKLLLRWGAISPVPNFRFEQPFARSQAWLLLQERVLRVLPDQKEITFYGSGEVELSRIAARRLLDKVVSLIQLGGTSEAQSVSAKFGTQGWQLEQEIDFVLWSWAAEQLRQARTDDWDKGKWQWKFDGGRATRA